MSEVVLEREFKAFRDVWTMQAIKRFFSIRNRESV